ncbi:MAG: hypothetical protein AB7R89_05730 [Dehalococcoidia bacterium]
MRETLDVELVSEERLDLRELLHGDDDIQVEAVKGLDVGVHRLAADQTVPDLVLSEKSDQTVEKVNLIGHHNLPECFRTHNSFSLNKAARNRPNRGDTARGSPVTRTRHRRGLKL